MSNNADKYIFREIRYLDYISLFSRNIQYVKEKENTLEMESTPSRTISWVKIW